jgi:hypothetical protein
MKLKETVIFAGLFQITSSGGQIIRRKRTINP